MTFSPAELRKYDRIYVLVDGEEYSVENEVLVSSETLARPGHRESRHVVLSPEARKPEAITHWIAEELYDMDVPVPHGVKVFDVTADEVEII